MSKIKFDETNIKSTLTIFLHKI